MKTQMRRKGIGRELTGLVGAGLILLGIGERAYADDPQALIYRQMSEQAARNLENKGQFEKANALRDINEVFIINPANNRYHQAQTEEAVRNGIQNAVPRNINSYNPQDARNQRPGRCTRGSPTYATILDPANDIPGGVEELLTGYYPMWNDKVGSYWVLITKDYARWTRQVYPMGYRIIRNSREEVDRPMREAIRELEKEENQGKSFFQRLFKK